MAYQYWMISITHILKDIDLLLTKEVSYLSNIQYQQIPPKGWRNAGKELKQSYEYHQHIVYNKCLAKKLKHHMGNNKNASNGSNKIQKPTMRISCVWSCLIIVPNYNIYTCINYQKINQKQKLKISKKKK